MPLGRQKIKETHPPDEQASLPAARRRDPSPREPGRVLCECNCPEQLSFQLTFPPRRHRASTSQDVWRPPTVPPCLFHVSGSGATWLLSTHNKKKGPLLSGASVRTVKHDENRPISKSLNQINEETKHSKWWPQHITPIDPLFPSLTPDLRLCWGLSNDGV